MAKIKAKRINDIEDTNVQLAERKAIETMVNLYKKVLGKEGKKGAIQKIAEVAIMAVGGEQDLLVKAVKGVDFEG